MWSGEKAVDGSGGHRGQGHRTTMCWRSSPLPTGFNFIVIFLKVYLFDGAAITKYFDFVPQINIYYI